MSLLANDKIMEIFGRYYYLVAVAFQFGREDFTEIDFRASGRRSVIVGQVEMGNAAVESMTNHFDGYGKIVRIAEIVP
jgi:hypothetical protein